ncbi:MAG: hypothetical protein Q8O00_01235 [Holophaga sp.]|nr:hypothetical protein [Holophaga sp.]
MRSQLFAAPLAGALTLSATQAPSQPPIPQINYKHLPQRPFEVKGLKITVLHFAAGTFKMKLTNTTSGFIAFAPEDMAFVDNSGYQHYLAMNLPIGASNSRISNLIPRLRIAPGASVRLDCWLNSLEQFPIKIYCFDQLCVVVTE